MGEPLAELAAYFRTRSRLTGEDLVRLTAAARSAGNRWDAIAAACGVRTYEDLAGVLYRITGETGAELLFSATQHALEQLTGGQRRYPPLTWACPECGRQVTDRAPAGRPVHVEHGHAPGCARLARDQAAEDQRRHEQLPRLIVRSEPAVGPVQRHWLAARITDDCPRCGWHGYFHHYLATIDGDWAAAVCDDCWADYHPYITVAVRFFSARSGGGEPFAVIRQRQRSDGGAADRGQMMTWRLAWEFTSMLGEEAHGGADADIAEVSRGDAEQITAGLAARYWPPDAARLPWMASAYPGRVSRWVMSSPVIDMAQLEDRHGRLFGLLILLEDRLGAGEAELVHRFIAAGEYALALDDMAGWVAYKGLSITDQERSDMLALARQMGMEDEITRALASRPGEKQPPVW
jgi:hypothetical protein